MKRILVFIALVFGTITFAQEVNLPIINQYMADNTYVLSPAYAGIGDCWQARGSGIQQWLGVENAPSTQTLSVDGRIHNRSGIGGILYNDSNGNTSQRGVKLSFAHHLTLEQYSKQYLSFGISYKYSQFSINTENFNEPSLLGADNFQVSDNNFDISLLYRLKGFFLNVNVINLLNKNIQIFNSEEPKSIRSYYLYTGYLIKDEYKDIEYEPSLMYRQFVADERSTMDFNIKVRKFNKENYFWGGLSFRTIVDQGYEPMSLSPMIGFKRNQFYFAYGYQAYFNDFSAVEENGSHMVTVGIDFKCAKSNCGCTN